MRVPSSRSLRHWVKIWNSSQQLSHRCSAVSSSNVGRAVAAEAAQLFDPLASPRSLGESMPDSKCFKAWTMFRDDLLALASTLLLSPLVAASELGDMPKSVTSASSNIVEDKDSSPDEAKEKTLEDLSCLPLFLVRFPITAVSLVILLRCETRLSDGILDGEAGCLGGILSDWT